MAPSFLLFASAKIDVFYQSRKFLNNFLVKNARVSEFYCIFAPANRDLAQLVAHYVRDVGVAGSSPVIPTASGGKAEYRHQRHAYLPDIDRKRTLRRAICNHRRNTLTLNALQKATFYTPKGHLPQCERWPFRTRFAVFYKTAGRITSPNRALVSPSVLPRRALPCRYCPSCRLPYAMSDRNCFAGSRGRRR